MARLLGAMFLCALMANGVAGSGNGAAAWQMGDIQGNPAMQEAYQMGKNIS